MLATLVHKPISTTNKNICCTWVKTLDNGTRIVSTRAFILLKIFFNYISTNYRFHKNITNKMDNEVVYKNKNNVNITMNYIFILNYQI